MIEAWWRALKHQWLFLHSLDSVATVHRLVEFYVQEHNRVLPHSAFRGQTPDERYFRHRRRGARRPDVTRRRRTTGPRRGQPIGGLRDLPLDRRGRLITDDWPPSTTGTRGPVPLETKPGETGTARRTSTRAGPVRDHVSLLDCGPDRVSDENSCGKVRNVRRDSSANRRRNDGIRRVVEGPGKHDGPQLLFWGRRGFGQEQRRLTDGDVHPSVSVTRAAGPAQRD
jgi:hypothetical protein